jgi:hypothetical protein
MKKKLFVLFLIFWLLLMLCRVLTGCSDMQVSRIDAPYRPFRIVGVCLASDSTYPRPYFKLVVSKLADWTLEAVNLNQDGLTEYINLLSSRADPSAATVATITINALPADSPAPKDDGNSYDYADKYQAWQDTLTHNHTLLDEEKQRVKPYIDSIRKLNPPVTAPDSGSLQGCIAAQALRFALYPKAEHILIIASPMYPLGNFDSSFLKNCRVYVLARYTPSVSTAVHDNWWRQEFYAMGVQPSDLHIYDEASTQSLTVSPF